MSEYCINCERMARRVEELEALLDRLPGMVRAMASPMQHEAESSTYPVVADAIESAIREARK